MKKTLLIVGCGDIALRTVLLLQSYYRIFGLFRNLDGFKQARSNGIIPIYGDLDDRSTLGRLAGIAQTVIHLAPPPNHGLRDTRTANLLSALTFQTKLHQRILPQRLVYISTSGVYGNCDGAFVDETHQVNPTSERALRRVDAERQIRQWGLRNHVSVSLLRVPGIYAASRMPLTRLREGQPAILEEEDSYTNHIHADDLAQIIYAALRYARSGRVYHATDDSQIKMGRYFDLVADQFNLPRPPRITREEAKERISPRMMSFMNDSRRLKNNRMKKELYVKLRYPTVLDGIKAGAQSM
ncbi:MAG: SDR family oxidoreductase [Betaproteobacteria bacterium]|nr:SDR family oxidoreductase [Betaproteobacteria bacterium]